MEPSGDERLEASLWLDPLRVWEVDVARGPISNSNPWLGTKVDNALVTAFAHCSDPRCHANEDV